MYPQWLKVIKTGFLGFLLVLSGNLWAENSKIETDPFVVLYETRLEGFRVAVKQAQVAASMAEQNYNAHSELRAKEVVSAVELQKSYVRFEKAKLNIKQSEAQLEEFRLILELVKQFRIVGRDVPLF